eukprot:scaffold140750_cov27-Tisochrysis_lutea.AAC.1
MVGDSWARWALAALSRAVRPANTRRSACNERQCHGCGYNLPHHSRRRSCIPRVLMLRVCVRRSDHGAIHALRGLAARKNSILFLDSRSCRFSQGDSLVYIGIGRCYL